MKTVILCAHFGKLPDMFPYFLKSCEANHEIDWLIFTDDSRSYRFLPSNVMIDCLTFQQFVKLVQEKFDFSIVLDSYIKICDYRPAFGYIFADRIRGYDYWGHCDLDVVWGRIQEPLYKAMWSNYEKIFTKGHLTVYKNEYNNNRKFMHGLYSPEFQVTITYRQIFSISVYCNFDESNLLFDIHKIYDDLQIPYLVSEAHVAEPYANTSHFVLPQNPQVTYRVFEWKNGILRDRYLQNGALFSDEYGYCHLRERALRVKEMNFSHTDEFIITPDAFLPEYSILDESEIQHYCKNADAFPNTEKVNSARGQTILKNVWSLYRHFFDC